VSGRLRGSVWFGQQHGAALNEVER